MTHPQAPAPRRSISHKGAHILPRRLALAACLASQALWPCMSALPAFAAPATPATPAAPAPAPNAERIRQAELDQARIKAQTQRVAGELDAIVAEFNNAGLGNGEDARVLNAIRGHLNKLSADDMAKVVELLQGARASGGLRDVAGAFGKQKDIVVHLRQILLAYQQQQELYELSLLFGKLADRQNANLKLAKRLVRATTGRSSATFDEGQRLNLSVQGSEQSALKAETGGLLDKLKTLIAQVDPETASRLKQSLDQAEQAKLSDLLSSAADDLKNASVYRAATTEMQARDALRELSRLVAPPLDTIELLRHAAEEIQRATLAQKAIVPKTDSLSPVQNEQNVEYGFEMEELEADVVDHVAGIRKDIDNAAPDAAAELGKGVDRMQEVRSAMVERKKEPSLAGQRQAIVNLETARSLVLARLMKEQQKDEQKDALATLKELRDKVVELKHKEEGLKKDTLEAKATPARQDLAPGQGQLQKSAQELQAEAAPQSAPAADAIGEAAGQMTEAEGSLKKGEEARQNAKPEQAAIEQLAKAEKVLDEEIKKLEKAEQDLAKLEEAREKVAELIKKETGVELKTAQAQAAQQKSQPDNARGAADAKPIAGEQGQVADQTGRVASELPDVGQAAAAPLQAAQGEMKDAKGNLDKNEAAQARPPEKNALAALQKAKDALDQKAAELAQELGEPDPNAEANADLGQAIADAQGDTAQAEQAAQAGQAGPARKLAQTARKLADAAAQASPPPSVSQPLAKAEEALADAAAQADAGNAEAAEAGAEQAEAALAQAAAALALSQSGIGGQVASAQGQEQGQGQGQEQGQGPGQEPGHGPSHSAQESHSQGRGDRMNTRAAAGDRGDRANVRTPGQFIGLPPRDRKAILQSQKESAPAEYAPYIEQYLRNLADPENQ